MASEGNLVREWVANPINATKKPPQEQVQVEIPEDPQIREGDLGNA